MLRAPINQHTMGLLDAANNKPERHTAQGLKGVFMLKFTLQVIGATDEDIIDGIKEALASYRSGNLSGFQDGEDGRSFNFDVNENAEFDI